MKTNFDYKGFLFVAVCAVLVALGVFGAQYGGEALVGVFPDAGWSFLNDGQAGLLVGQARVDGQASIPIAQTSKEDPQIRLGFVGDIMLDRGVKHKIKTVGGGSYEFPFQYASSTLRSYDILFGNLEGPVSDKGANRGSIYSFRMDPKAVLALKNAGFDVLSVANNHMGDWGTPAMTDTFARLAGAGIVPVGGGLNKKEAHEPKIVDAKGIKIAYLAYSQFGRGYTEAGSTTPGIAIIDKDSIAYDVSYAKRTADVVIVSFHFGDEYQDNQNAFQERIAHSTVDAGADVVVGHHPHVIEPIEQYKGKIIAYSLGNFVFDQAFSQKTMTGMMLEISLKEKSIDRVSTSTAILNSDFQPQIQLGDRVAK